MCCYFERLHLRFTSEGKEREILFFFLCNPFARYSERSEGPCILNWCSVPVCQQRQVRCLETARSKKKLFNLRQRTS